MNVSVVIPVYNSEASLPALVERLRPVLEEAAGAFELILVDDASRDRSWAVVKNLCYQYPWVRAIQLMRNCGQHNALLCGIREAAYPVTVTMDDDLQNPPEEIPKLLAKLEEGYDVVYGTPQLQRHGLWRKLASQVTKLTLQTTLGAETANQVSTFRAFRTQTQAAFSSYRGPYLSIDVLLTWGAMRFAAIRVRHDPRRVGRSNYTFRITAVRLKVE